MHSACSDLVDQMVLKRVFTCMFIITTLYLLLSHQFALTRGALENYDSMGVKKYLSPFHRKRIIGDPTFNDYAVDDDFLDYSKRQTKSDDYSHMRFGRKGEEISDDYGHMRFGRSRYYNKK